MAIQFLTGINIDGNIDLNSNQIKEVRIDNESSAPSGSLGRIYYDTTSNKLRLYNGSWVDITTGTGANTTYDLSVPATTTKIRLAGSDGTNDDVEIAGSGLITVTRTSSSVLTLSTTATSNTGTVTSVTAGTGLSQTGTSTVNPTILVDYLGSDNIISSAPTNTSVDKQDWIMYADNDDSLDVKKCQILDMPGFGADGTVTSVSAGDGIVITGTATTTPTVNVDYAGGTNVILDAADGTSVTLVDADDFLFNDDSDNNVKYANLSQLKTYINAGAGSVTSINVSGGTTGLTFAGGPITSSGTITMSGTLDEVNGGTGQTTYTTGDILYASGSNTLAKLAIGSAGQVLKVASGVPSWATDQNSGGTVTSITLAADSGSGSAITTSGTFTFTGGTNVTTSVSGTTVTINSTDQYSGTVTSIGTPADGGLTGGTITSSGNLRLKNYSSLSANKVMKWDNSNNQLTNSTITDDGTDVSMTGVLTVSGTGQSSFGGQVTVPTTPSAATDAASKAYVLSQVGGVGGFQGGYNANTNSPALTGGSNVALNQGDFYVVTTAGTFFSDNVEVGDFIFANSNISASSSPSASDYTVVIADENIAGSGTTDGGTQKGVAGFNSGPFSVTANGWVGINTGGITDAMLAETYNQIIGTDSDINTSGIIVIDQLNMTDGVIQSHTTRNLPTTSQTNLGVIEMANTTEVNTGTSTILGISPATLKESHDAQSYTTTFPASSATTFSIAASTHKLGTGPFIIQVYNKNGVQVFMDTDYNTSSGEVRFNWTTSSGANTYTCVIMKM